MLEVFDQWGYGCRVLSGLRICIYDGRTRVAFEDVPGCGRVVVYKRVMENSTLDERERRPLRLGNDDREKYGEIVLACAWRIAVKK